LLNHQPMGFYPPQTIRLEASRRGITFLPVDINESGPAYLPGERTIRLSLGQVKDMGTHHLEAILKAREAGPFTGLADFCRRVKLPRHIIMNLILIGAFDSLHPNRRALLWQLRRGEGLLPPPEIDDFSPYQKFLYEYSLLGLTAGGHLIGFLRPKLAQRGILARAQLDSYPAEKKVQVAGLVIRPHRPPTKSGRTVVFLTLEDETGIIDVTVFENVYRRFGHLLFSCPALIVAGTLQRRGAGLGIIARQVEALPLASV
jgi:error-prone DNA polymerase